MALMEACCDIDESEYENERDFVEKVGTLITDRIDGKLIPASSEVVFFQFPKAGANATIFSELDRARHQLQVQLCYCSVLDTCWVAGDGEAGPVSVDSCDSSEELRYQ